MKQKFIGWSQGYMRALRKYLKQETPVSLQAALRLGRQAVARGLETLELIRIHERALATLELPQIKNGLNKRAEIFLTEVTTPMVETHPIARQRRIQLNGINETLSQRTWELAAANHRLQCGMIQRMSMESALKKCGERYTALLKESRRLQEGLRQLTHQVLRTRENERRNISRELQDDIAQTLLGINIRLLSLKQEARSNTQGLKNEIASTQRLVVKSVKSVHRVTRGLRKV